MKKLLSVASAAALLAGCAAYKPVPDNYAGPLATVADSGYSEDGTKARIFALTEVDGHAIQDSFDTSRQASFNQGMRFTLRLAERQLPAAPMKVRLVGSHATGAPIHELASRAAGTFFSVEGVVDFSPKPHGRYIVKGELSKTRSLVWIEDAETREPATAKIEAH